LKIIQACWEKDPEKRASCEEVLIMLKNAQKDYASHKDSWNNLFKMSPQSNNNQKGSKLKRGITLSKFSSKYI
jgi:hypothetical protein